MISTLKSMGYRPKMRGGNGVLTPQQKKLADALGLPVEYAIATGKIYGSPNCYKVDIAHIENKLAIEVDGHSHKLPKRRQEDAKKERVLLELGWKVIRFWNQEIDSDVQECISRVRAILGN